MASAKAIEKREARLEERQLALFAELEKVTNLPAGSIRLAGLELTNPDMTMDEWLQILRVLGPVRKWAAFAIGDALLFGEALFGEEAAQGVDGTADRYDVATRITGLSASTLQNYASVCARVARRRRRIELDFGHHEAVAALDPDEQTVWLQRAADEGWTREELRAAIREEKNPAVNGDEPVVVLPPDGAHLTLGERVEQAARLCYHQAQRTSGGEALVPAEPWSQLGSALGEE